jgi:ATP-dependent RNA helicase DDX6/DHH1
LAAYQAAHGIQVDTRHQTEDVIYEQGDITFQSMGLSLNLLKGIADCGFTSPSPIQAQAIPKILMQGHVIARAKNGTGKTAAFCIPIVHMIEPSRRHVQAVILGSTRELVCQIAAFVERLTAHLPIKVLVSYGGNDFRSDMVALQQGVHILVATTGRVENFCRHGFLNDAKIVAIDEADKIFNLDFQFIEQLFTSYLPSTCQKVLFSATYPHSIAIQAQKYLPNASWVNAMDEITLRGVTQHYVVVEEKSKLKMLEAILNMLKVDQCIIFCNSPQRAQALAQRITSSWGKSCFALTGAMSQPDRTTISTQFRQKKFKYLAATDVLARGFDLVSLNVVINFDLSPSPETYLHRIGRSGRFGHLGLAINLVAPTDGSLIQLYEDKLQTQITQLPRVLDASTYADGVVAEEARQAAAEEAVAQQPVEPTAAVVVAAVAVVPATPQAQE